MAHVEHGTHVTYTRRRVLAQATAHGRSPGRRPSNAKVQNKARRTGLLHGAAAEQAFIALFESIDDFDSAAHDAAVAPLPPTD
jgi:hypothetical protein